MKEVKVLVLDGCSHCEALKASLVQEKITFEILDANQNSKLADRMEAILKVNHYPMVIIESGSGAIYLYREDVYEKAKATPIGYAVKIGCASVDMMVDQIKKHLK